MITIWEWVFINIGLAIVQHYALVDYYVMEQYTRMVDINDYYKKVDSGEIPRVIVVE